MKNSTFRFHLQQLDLALLALLQERVRLCSNAEPGLRQVAIEDLLRRADGSVPAEGLRAIFTALDRACGEGSADRGDLS